LDESFLESTEKKHKGLGDAFYLDEVFVKINGVQYYLWRDVDQDGEGVDVLLRKRGMRKFKSTIQAQRFPGLHATVYTLFNLARHFISSKNHRIFTRNRFSVWVSIIA